MRIDEIQMVNALLRRLRSPTGGLRPGEAKFVRDLRARHLADPRYTITARQRRWLAQLYRDHG